MAPFRTPEDVADQMIEVLFEDIRLPGRKRILYPGCGEGELIEAVDRYFEDKLSDPPSGVAIDTAEENIETVREKYGELLTVQKGDYLSDETRFEDRFDFILSYPPTIQWQDLTPEKREEYANSFARITPDTNQIHNGLLFLERSLHTLNEGGRGVFLTPKAFKADDAAAPFRSHIISSVSDVEPVESADFGVEIPHMITVLNSFESESFEAAPSSFSPEPSEIEAQMMASASAFSPAEPVTSIATSLQDLTVYPPDKDAAFVYLDMYYENYDAALIYEDPERLEGVMGYVSRAKLEVTDLEEISRHVLPLESSICIEPDAGFASVIKRLGQDSYRFCFVGNPRNPEGIVTRFDLNKLPIYQYLFTQFARFEIQLRKTIRENVPNWDEIIENSEDVYIRSSDVGELAPDKLGGGSVKNLLKILSEADATQSVPCRLQDFEASLDDLRKLRNSVAHYEPIIHSMSNDTDTKWTANTLKERHSLLQAVIG